MFIWTVVKRSVGISMIVLGLMLFGMKGLLAGVVFNSWFSYFVNIALVSKYVGYRWTEQLHNIMPVTFVSILSAFIAYGVGLITDLPLYPDGLVKASVYLAIYAGWSIIFKPEAYRYFLDIVPDRINIVKKIKNNKK